MKIEKVSHRQSITVDYQSRVIGAANIKLMLGELNVTIGRGSNSSDYVEIPRIDARSLALEILRLLDITEREFEIVTKAVEDKPEETEVEPIPKDIYWVEKDDTFYKISGDDNIEDEPMPRDFRNLWYPRRSEFVSLKP
jgi:hypothetical protein